MYYPNTMKNKQVKHASLTMGLLNLMPNKLQTQQQWQRAFERSDFNVHWLEFGLETHIPKSKESREFKEKSMRLTEDIWPRLDGLIITGAPVEKLPFESVGYWEELYGIIKMAQRFRCPLLTVCWGAQASLYANYSINKVIFEEKITGVFEHQAINHFKELEVVKLPHSRFSGWVSEQLYQNNHLTPLLFRQADEIVAVLDNERNLYFSGHPEYDEETLAQEYRRDVSNGIMNTKPSGYKIEGDQAFLKGCYWGRDFGKMLNIWLKIIKNEEN